MQGGVGTAACSPIASGMGLQSGSSSKGALSPLFPPGKEAEQFPPIAHPHRGDRRGQPLPWAGQKGWGVTVSA